MSRQVNRPQQVYHRELKEGQGGTRIYCIASEYPVMVKGKLEWRPHTINLHALDYANAKFLFMSDPDHRLHRIVAIGPVVGMFVDDNHGDKLRI